MIFILFMVVVVVLVPDGVMEAALSEARDANLSSPELEEAEAALELAKRRLAARETLRAACARCAW